MGRIISLWLPVAFLFVLLPRTSEAQTTYDSTDVKVFHGDPTSAVFTFNSNLTQVQFRCVNGGNPTWFYYTRPNTSVNWVYQGDFRISGGCQYSYSTDGDIHNDILTAVVNAPLTGKALNGQTVTVVFANFTSDKDGCCYDTVGGNSRITVQ